MNATCLRGRAAFYTAAVSQMFYRDRHVKALRVVLALAMVAVCIVFFNFSSTRAYAATETRLAGENRYHSAWLDFKDVWGNTTPPGMVIVCGTAFPDAAPAVALAGALNYGLLLTEPSTINATYVDAFISAYSTKNFILVGGTASISAYAESQITAQYSARWNSAPIVKRVSGATRQATAEAVCTYGGSGWGDTAIVASGENFPDALSIAALANYKKFPVFYADANGNITSTSKSAIASKCTKAIIMGGSAVVNTSTESALKTALGATNVTRCSGNDRYITSALAASLAATRGLSYANVGIASGQNFPDAVSGSAAQGKRGGVFILVTDGQTSNAISVLAGKTGSNLRVYGGTAVVSDPVVRAIRIPISTRALMPWDLVGTGNAVNWTGGTGYQAQFNAAASVWNSLRPGFTPIKQAQTSSSSNAQVYDYTENSTVFAVTGYNSSQRYIKFNTHAMNQITTDYKKSVCLHELGHAMGLEHNTAADVMYAYQAGHFDLSVNDRASFDAAWARHGV